MKELLTICNEMQDELHGAKDYAKKYQALKVDMPLLAKKYYEMATDELKHAGYFHDMVVEKMKECKESLGEIPEYIADVWEEKNNYYIDKVSCVKVILNM